MFTNKIPTKALFVILFLITVVGCSDVVKSEVVVAKKNPAIMLEVHKSPTCGCCQDWIDHIDAQGIQSSVIEDENVALIKNQLGIAPRYRSCHTAISTDGYIFEGHVPAKYIAQFITESHEDNVLGLAVPAMPVGSPGMEVGDKFMPYQVLVLKSDGSAEVYAEVTSYQQQF